MCMAEFQFELLVLRFYVRFYVSSLFYIRQITKVAASCHHACNNPDLTETPAQRNHVWQLNYTLINAKHFHLQPCPALCIPTLT